MIECAIDTFIVIVIFMMVDIYIIVKKISNMSTY